MSLVHAIVHETSEEGRHRGWDVRRGGHAETGREPVDGVGGLVRRWAQRQPPEPRGARLAAKPPWRGHVFCPTGSCHRMPTALGNGQATGKQLHAPATCMRCAKCVVEWLPCARVCMRDI